MNKLRAHSDGFTLIEMIVVILIIMTLMGLVLTVSSGVIDRARKTQAKNDLTQIVTAVNAFYTEYGKYPVYSTTAITDDSDFSNAGAGITNGGDAFTNRGDNSLVIDVLRNNVSAVGTNLTWVQNLNPRGIVFLQVPAVSGTIPRSGVAAPGSTLPGTWYGPWGSPYRIRIDTSYNNLVDGPYSANAGTSSSPNGNLSVGVIAWSLGKDGQGGSGDKSTGNAKDDVISWQ